ncbi:MAG: CBS domain-containing protein [Candidatus Deferrimicrobiaceae bacterium]
MPEDPSFPKLVRDLMSVGVETCTPDTPIIELARAMIERNIEEVVVLEEGNAIGIVGQDEVIKAFLSEDYRSLSAEDVMVEGVPEIPPDIPLQAAAQFMQDRGLRTLFLMHQSAGFEYPAAVITYRHLLRLMAAKDMNDLKDLGIQAERQSPLDVFIKRRDAARKGLHKK